MEGANAFHLKTHWSLPGRIEEVCEILNDPASFVDWWGDVYLNVEILDDGDDRGIGGAVQVLTRGALPYRLRWTGRLVEENRPKTWRIRAEGDLDGEGVWHLRQNGEMAELTYDWTVLAEKPVLRVLSPLLKPVFAWNHNWAMAKGLDGLKSEMARRFPS